MQKLRKLRECAFCHFEVRNPCTTAEESQGCADMVEEMRQAHSKPRTIPDDDPMPLQQRASYDD